MSKVSYYNVIIPSEGILGTMETGTKIFGFFALI